MDPSQQPVPVPLTREPRRFVEEQVRSGRFSSAAEVLLGVLRVLQEQEAFIDANREGDPADDRGGGGGGGAGGTARRRGGDGAMAAAGRR